MQMFHADDYELQALSEGHCPFCRKSSDSVTRKLVSSAVAIILLPDRYFVEKNYTS